MRKEILNGTPIPYELPLIDLKKMMSSPIMKDFSLACEALSYNENDEAYEIMKEYINDKDKYRRLYVLKTIFRHSKAVELVYYVENAISSDDFLFVENGLLIVANYKIKASESLLLSAIGKNLHKLYTELYALTVLDACENNYIKIVELFKKVEQCAQKEIISQVLIENYASSKAKDLFDLFSCDKFAKIRGLAFKLAKAYGYNISKIFCDRDGHIKKLAVNLLGELSFLLEYASAYRVDISDDLKSAIIYNSASDEHLCIEYLSNDEFTPYLLSFSFQHVHLTDKESAKKWIDDILSENLFAIEYFKGKEKLFGGEINKDELNDLTYKYLEQDMGCFGITKLYQIADCFKVRGWSTKNDFDGFFVEENNGIKIKKVFKA